MGPLRIGGIDDLFFLLDGVGFRCLTIHAATPPIPDDGPPVGIVAIDHVVANT